LEPDYLKLMWEIAHATGIFDERIKPILKRHFEQFEKDVIAKLQSELDEVMYNTPLAEYGIHTGLTPMCPGIADKNQSVFKPAGQSLLEALKAGAENPGVNLNAPCPVCTDLSSYCSYCARGMGA
jgi:hypothetical protein